MISKRFYPLFNEDFLTGFLFPLSSFIEKNVLENQDVLKTPCCCDNSENCECTPTKVCHEEKIENNWHRENDVYKLRYFAPEKDSTVEIRVLEGKTLYINYESNVCEKNGKTTSVCSKQETFTTPLPSDADYKTLKANRDGSMIIITVTVNSPKEAPATLNVFID